MTETHDGGQVVDLTPDARQAWDTYISADDRLWAECKAAGLSEPAYMAYLVASIKALDRFETDAHYVLAEAWRRYEHETEAVVSMLPCTLDDLDRYAAAQGWRGCDWWQHFREMALDDGLLVRVHEAVAS